MNSKISCILTDIEGTISSTTFVRKVLFPYASDKLPDFIKNHHQEPAVRELLNQTAQIAGLHKFNLDKLIDTLLQWIKEDRKETALKTLQGMIWEEGYRSGAYQADLFDAAYENLKQWKSEGKTIYVYSSGSIKAQELFFTFNEKGNILHLFDGLFDTTIGPKNETQSYLNILAKINKQADEVIFYSDSFDEIKAAQKAGLVTVNV